MQKHDLTLISGTFSRGDAAEILGDMLQRKISYHQSKKFGLEERFGHDHLNCRQRVKELQITLQQLRQFLNDLPPDCEMEIESLVKVRVHNPNLVTA